MHKYFPGDFESLIKWRKDQQHRSPRPQRISPQENLKTIKIHPLIYMAVFILILIAESQGKKNASITNSQLSERQGDLLRFNATCDLGQAYTGFYSLLRSLIGTDFHSDLASGITTHRASGKSKKFTEDEKISIRTFHKNLAKTVLEGDVKYLQELIVYGLDVNAPIRVTLDKKKGSNERSAHLLHIGLLSSKVESIKSLRTLLDAGANPNTISYGVHPVTIAVCINKEEATYLLFSKGATLLDFKPNERITLEDSNYGVIEFTNGVPFYYPLHVALRYEPSMVAQFVGMGADLDAKDFQDLRPLHYAVKFSPQHIELLMKNGANANLRDKAGRTPLECAVAESLLNVAEILLELGAPFDKNELLKHFWDQKRSKLDRKKWVSLFDKYEALRKAHTKNKILNYVKVISSVFLTIISLGTLIWTFLTYRNKKTILKNDKKKMVAHEKRNTHSNITKSEAVKAIDPVFDIDVEPLNKIISRVEEITDNNSALSSKKKTVIEKFINQLKYVYEINSYIIEHGYHESSEKNIKKFASSINVLADQSVEKLLWVLRIDFNVISRNSLNLRKEINDLLAQYQSLISSVKSLVNSEIKPEAREQILKDKASLISSATTLQTKIKSVDEQQNDLHKELIKHDNSFDNQLSLIEKHYKSLRIAIGKQEKLSSGPANNAPALTAPLSMPEQNRAANAPPAPVIIAPAPVPTLVPSLPVTVKQTVPTQKLDDRHLREQGVVITPSRKAQETSSTDFVSTPSILRQLKASALASKNIPTPVPTNPTYKANLVEHRQAILKTLEKMKAVKLQPGSLDAEIYRYSLSFNLFQLAHNVWLLALDIQSNWKNIPLKVQTKFVELHRVITLFRHMLAHMPVNFEMEDLISTATQFSSDDFMGIVDAVTNLKEPENLPEEEHTLNNIQILKKEIEDSKLYAHLYSTEQKERNPSTIECLLKIGYVLELTGKISKVFTTLHEFNLYMDSSDATKMLMLIAGEFSKPLDDGVRIRITKTPEYLNLKIYDLLDRIYDYRNLMAHMPEELEKKVRVVSKEDLNYTVYRFAGVIDFAQKQGVLSPFIQLLLERNHSLIQLTPAENAKPVAVTLSPPATAATAKPKLNPNATVFVPLARKQPAFRGS